MQVPVYLFTGFLESGKTTFMQETMEEGSFDDGEKTLLLLCEQGVEEFEPDFLKRYNIVLVEVEFEDLNNLFLEDCKKKYKPSRVFIEYNGMWKMEALFQLNPPKNWTIVQNIHLINAETYDVYRNNMKSLAVDQFSTADMVIFNRCTETTDRASYRRNIKAVNRRAQVYFEGDFEVGEEDELPFDKNAEVIRINDEDYGIWYIDAMDNPDQYRGKTVTFKGRVFKSKELGANCFVPGRHAMTCCADDIAFLGFICKAKDLAQIEQRQWVTVTAEFKVEYRHEYKGKGPVLYCQKMEKTEEPLEELVYF